jgi:hypothetical protein
MSGSEDQAPLHEPERVAPEDGSSATMVFRPATEGGLEAAPREEGDYRSALRSRRWDAAPLRNPEVEKTDPRIAVAFIVAIAAITFVVVVLGYASGFWQLPA